MRLEGLMVRAGALLAVAGVMAGAPARVVAAGAEASDGRPRTVLVELFTSEGCSSCPPADALLAKINGRETEAGALIVGLSEHVTYWNRQGWVDPFSQEMFTERQRSYGMRFHLDDVYTPQMVVNGAAQMVGSDARGLLQALTAERASGLELTIDAVDGGDARKLAVTFSVSGQMPKHGVEIYAVVADDRDSSQVGRGENAGRSLTHVAVARTLTRVAVLPGAGTRTVSVTLPGVVSGQARDGKRHLVLFAQTAHLGPVLAVESKEL